MADFNLNKFEAWLVESGKSHMTAGVYASAVRQALREFNGPPPSKLFLDAYAAGLPSPRRGVFRTAWRWFTRFAASNGVELPEVAFGKLGAPPRVKPWATPRHAFAIAYLLRAVPAERLGPRGLRWPDADLLGPADAVLRDRAGFRRYHVHRRALDVLLAWGRPDGQPLGAIVPNEPGGRQWLDVETIETLASAARAAAEANAYPDEVAALLWTLPPPRSEVWNPNEPENGPVDPSPRSA